MMRVLTAIRRRFSRRPYASIDVAGNSIALRVGRKCDAISLESIEAVFGERLGKISYDENFIILEDASGRMLSLGELDPGFGQAMTLLAARLEGFPADWYGRIGESDGRTLLWRR